tara:strand:+ start:156 stop:1148 length:993 start_codon:yes stop_codon:yes gene_type:complete
MKKFIRKYKLELLFLYIYGIFSIPFVLWIRFNIKKNVGFKKFKSINKLKLISFPEIIGKPYSIFQGGYAIEKILLAINLSVEGHSRITSRSLFTNNSPANCIFLNWQGLTKDEIKFENYLTNTFSSLGYKEEFFKSKKVNVNCNDISKEKVGNCFQEIFKYQLNIDPTTYKGLGVEKSDDNGAHDGKLISLPITKDLVKEKKIYNICVNNLFEKDFITDYRIPFIGELSSFCYEKKRHISKRFANQNYSVKVLPTKNIFTSEELDKISSMCNLMKLDYGEIDCLIDADTKKIYVIDINKTPIGPPKELPLKKKIDVIITMSTSFVKNFCN